MAENMSNLGKQAKKDSAAESSRTGIAAAYILDLLEQLRAALATYFETSLANLDKKLDKIQAVVSGQGQCVTGLESNAKEVCQCLEQLEATCSTLQENNKWLKFKLSNFRGVK